MSEQRYTVTKSQVIEAMTMAISSALVRKEKGQSIYDQALLDETLTTLTHDPEPSVEVVDILGEAMHTAFRKAGSSSSSSEIHDKIASMDDFEWAEIVNFVAYGIMPAITAEVTRQVESSLQERTKGYREALEQIEVWTRVTSPSIAKLARQALDNKGGSDE